MSDLWAPQTLIKTYQWPLLAGCSIDYIPQLYLLLSVVTLHTTREFRVVSLYFIRACITDSLYTSVDFYLFIYFGMEVIWCTLQSVYQQHSHCACSLSACWFWAQSNWSCMDPLFQPFSHLTFARLCVNRNAKVQVHLQDKTLLTPNHQSVARTVLLSTHLWNV